MRLRPGMRYSFRYFPPPEEIPGKGTFTTVFAPGAFDRHLGTFTRLMLNGRQIGSARVIAADVAEDGASVQFEYEVADLDPDQDHEIPVGRCWPPPDPDDLPHDPLVPARLRINWRDRPGQEEGS